MTGDAKALLLELGVTLDCALACGERMSEDAIVATDGPHFNQLILFVTKARILCSKGQQPLPPEATEPNIVYPRYSKPLRQVYPPIAPTPTAIYHRAEAARAAMGEAGGDMFEVTLDGAGRAKLVPIKD
jgi:hypothetical protein